MTTSLEPVQAAFDAGQLNTFARKLLCAMDMPPDRAQAVADILVEGDLLGHDTHGLQLLATYLGEIDAGRLTLHGDPVVLADHPAALAWDGRRLPGPWLVLRAIDVATDRARRLGTCTVSIRRSHHIAALAPYARRVAEQGMLLVLMSSSPSAQIVAPFGGTRGVFSPSPIGVGIPTTGEPMMVDVSTSITTNGMTGILAREGRRMPGAWLLDEQGVPTDDPNVALPPRKGTLLPLGGTDSGHKGYGLSLMVEALTAGLAGQGRSDPGEKWGGTLFVQVIDPQAFNGRDAFEREMDWVADACEGNPPVRAGQPVRLPGRGGLARRASQLAGGVRIKASVIEALQPWAARLGVGMPTPMGG